MQKITYGIVIWGSLACAAHASPSASSTTLYGIIDTAIRYTSAEAGSQQSNTRMIGGGMSQSRWGLRLREDLGAGNAVIANLEARFLSDTGEQATSNYFQQSWVGLQHARGGQLTLGRQYNVLFDLVATTYASFPYSPYMEALKPEVGFSVGARANNMVKYQISQGRIRTALQYSFDENGADSQTLGGYLRYSYQGLSVGSGFLKTVLPQGTRVDAWTLGASYRHGLWYFSSGYGKNKRMQDFSGKVDQKILSTYWSSTNNGGFSPGDATTRELYQVGIGYQATPQINLGAHYYHAKQSGSPSQRYNGTANFWIAMLDFAFSKRTDAYFGVDYTRVRNGGLNTLDSQNSLQHRTGITAGLRHRF